MGGAREALRPGACFSSGPRLLTHLLMLRGQLVAAAATRPGQVFKKKRDVILNGLIFGGCELPAVPWRRVSWALA